MQTELHQTLLAILIRINPGCDGSRVDLQTPLLEQGLLDSLQIVSMIGEIETELGCRIPLDEILPENFDTLSSVIALVRRCLQGSGV